MALILKYSRKGGLCFYYQEIFTAKREHTKMKLKTVNQNREFLRAYKKGRSFVDSTVVMYVFKNRYGFLRFGITSSKKVGNAVKRNRARRVIRASVRALEFDHSQGYDVILVARAKTAYVKQQVVESQLRILAEKAGLLKEC